MKKIFLLLVAILMMNNIAKAQYIVAGQHGLNDYFYSFAPDSNVINIIGSPDSVGNYYLDINNDGVMDFEFETTTPGNALGGDVYYCVINALNNNSLASGICDSCFNDSNVYVYSRNMAYAYKYGDSINDKSIWANSGYLEYTSFNLYQYNCNFLFSSDTAYIGVRMFNGLEYKYGWIKIVGLTFVPFYGSATLKMGAFACEYNNVGVKQIVSDVDNIHIYPNPTKDNLTIETNLNTQQRLDIINLMGQTVYNTSIINKKTTINTSAIAKGVYILKVSSDKGTKVKRFVKE